MVETYYDHRAPRFVRIHWYDRKFVQNYGIVARPHTNLLKKMTFKWSTKVDIVFGWFVLYVKI